MRPILALSPEEKQRRREEDEDELERQYRKRLRLEEEELTKSSSRRRSRSRKPEKAEKKSKKHSKESEDDLLEALELVKRAKQRREKSRPRSSFAVERWEIPLSEEPTAERLRGKPTNRQGPGRESQIFTLHAEIDGEVYRVADGQDPLHRGLAVIDSGATDTVGSPEALEMIAKRMRATRPDTEIVVEAARNTKFRLADGRITPAYSHITMRNASATFEAYCIDAVGTPALYGIKALEKSAAVIDFGRHEMTWVDGTGNRVQRKLERTEKGHLLLDLC